MSIRQGIDINSSTQGLFIFDLVFDKTESLSSAIEYSSET